MTHTKIYFPIISNNNITKNNNMARALNQELGAGRQVGVDQDASIGMRRSGCGPRPPRSPSSIFVRFSSSFLARMCGQIA